MKLRSAVIWIGFTWTLTACETLMTRGEVREAEQKRQMQDQVVHLQKTSADVNNRFADIEEELRSVNGRLEVVESKVTQTGQEREKMRAANEQVSSDQEKKLAVLQEEVVKLQEQLGAVTAELAAIKSAQSQDTGSSGKKDSFEQAEDLFEKKDWRKAILNYQKFRDANPKSKKFPEATYKIGVCFQELGMKEEAKTFFDEVIAKFPSSADAKKAKTRLKNLKK